MNSGDSSHYIKLKVDNYDQRSLSFLGSLKAKQKDCFIDDTMTIPDCGSSEYADWATVNTLIMSWIFTTLDSSLLPYVPYKDNAQKCFFWLPQMDRGCMISKVYQIARRLRGGLFWKAHQNVG